MTCEQNPILLQAGRKSGNDALNKCRELMDLFEKRLRLDDLRLIERYVESKLKILVRFRIGGIDEELIACFQRKANVGGPDGDQQVLLYVVQSVQCPDRVIPSFVWFESVDCFERLLPYTLYLSALFGFVFLGTVGDREVDPVGVRRAVPRVATNDLVGEMVESAHKVFNSVSSEQGQAVGRRFDARYVIDQLARIRIVLDSDFVGIRLKESSDLAIEVRDVLFGPFDF